jgi:antitoxin VapB
MKTAAVASTDGLFSGEEELTLAKACQMFAAYASRHPLHLEASMRAGRHVRLFRNGRNQALRIPVEFELPGDEAILTRDGDKLVIEPTRKRGLLGLLETMEPIDERFPEIVDRPPAPKATF